MAGLLETNIPFLVVTISIILSGIAIGIGRAFGNKKIEGYGKEEIAQALVNAAIFGGIAIILGTSVEISHGINQQKCLAGSAAIDELGCVLGKQVSANMFSLFQENSKLLGILGYYQTLNLDFGSFSIQPFVNIKELSGIIGSQLSSMQFNLMLLNLNLQITNFISKNALEVLFAFGLIFRMFFATRRLGGFLIALAIGLYLFYPSFVMIFSPPQLDYAIAVAKNFTNNSAYATVPIVDLNDNNAIAKKLDLMAGRTNITNQTNSTAAADFSGELTLVTQANAAAIADGYNYSVVAPILALIITVLFIKEVGNILGGEIGISSMI